jgi:predicted DCC family thiol-disulfide oxidoreductase YuxK
MNRPVRYPLTVFYDASCPLCAREMAVLLALDRHHRLELVDCSAPDFDDEGLRAEGITCEKLMRLIHVRDAHGQWLVGVAGLEAAYRAVGRERTAKLWGSRYLHPVLRPLYAWVARHRQTLSRLTNQRQKSDAV